MSIPIDTVVHKSQEVVIMVLQEYAQTNIPEEGPTEFGVAISMIKVV